MPGGRWIPVGIAGVGALASLTIAVAKPPLPQAAIPEARPLVAVATAAARHFQVTIPTQGNIAPSSEIDLASEVSGRVVAVSPALKAGGFVEKGEVLIELDPEDARIALEAAAASLELAGIEVRQASAVLERLRALASGGVASASKREDTEYILDLARAKWRAAAASHSMARRELQHTLIRAPFSGRVRTARTEVGQFVARGEPLARIYSSEAAEVRLPLTYSEIALLELPQPAATRSDVEDRGPLVNLRASFAGGTQRWTGRIVRVEAEVDLESRMRNAVARLDEPPELTGWQPGAAAGPPAVGLFVEAEILGRRFENVIGLPRIALRDGDRVLIVNGDGRVVQRRVSVVRVEGDEVLIDSGLVPGERVCVSVTPPSVGSIVRPVDTGSTFGSGEGGGDAIFLTDAGREP